MERVATWPNVVTVTRLIFGTYGIYIATLPHSFFIGISIFILLGLLPDLLDGWIAREFDQETRLGQFLDPSVDKVLFYLAIVMLFSEHVWWISISLLFLCDVASTVLHFFKNGGAVKSGKRKFLLQNCAFGFFVFGKLINENLIFMIANVLIICATFFAIHSLWSRYKKR